MTMTYNRHVNFKLELQSLKFSYSPYGSSFKNLIISLNRLLNSRRKQTSVFETSSK